MLLAVIIFTSNASKQLPSSTIAVKIRYFLTNIKNFENISAPLKLLN